MPIDSICSGCGKTLRVNEEFVGRKARCPACGTVYIAGGDSGEQSISPAQVETTYVAQGSDGSPLRAVDDSWTSLPTATNPTTPQVENAAASGRITASAPLSETMYFVRTPNSMVYGPSDAATVHDWIAQGRLDDTCHIREETSEHWLGIPAWRFQTRKRLNPMSNPAHPTSNQFGAVPVSAVQSLGYSKSGNGMMILILGLVSWVLCPTIIGAIICSILAIVFAMTELKKIREGTSPSKEKSLVLIGLFLSLANLAAISIAFVAIVVIAIVNP